MKPHFIDVDMDLSFEMFSKNENLAIYHSKQALEYEIRLSLTDEWVTTFCLKCYFMSTIVLFRFGLTNAHIMTECPLYYYIAFGLAKKSIYKKRFDQLIQRFQEAGLITKWNRDGLGRAKRLAKFQGQRTKINPLTLKETQGGFLVAAFLLIVSCFIFILEISLAKILNKKWIFPWKRIVSNQLIHQSFDYTFQLSLCNTVCCSLL